MSEFNESEGAIPIARPSEPRVLRPKRATPADAVRPTRAEVNLAALRSNLRVVQKHAKGAQVWAVLKADGYGHGAPAVARTLERAGANGFCVALLEEAVELREAGIQKPILVMGGYYPNAHAEVVARNLTPVLFDEAQMEGFSRIVKMGLTPNAVRVHLKVDTGMGRLGVLANDLKSVAERLRAYPELEVQGLMTHLACADSASSDHMDEQARRFDVATTELSSYGISPSVRHAANSAAVLRGKTLYDWVRPGIALFGVSPSLPTASGQTPLCGDLTLAMRVRTEIVDLRTVEEGASVGYGSTWRAKRRTVVATIPMGYADGLSRHLSNRGFALVRGKRAAIIGNVSMDMSMIDVTDHPGVSRRDEAVVLGQQSGPLGEDTISVDEIAEAAHTIPWEILTSISRRVPRFYREP
ncbi:MAG: alanine racemase [Polyangiaceae bacterium]|nr:alanine racemase [Polyangiaceae bacterium]